MIMEVKMAIIFILLFAVITAINGKTQPNIVFILADDLGWDDVSFHGSNQIPTPNIDTLAYDGIILNNYYVQPICTPSRSALMTGKHPIHTGMQHETINSGEPYGLSLDEKLLSDYLKELGYSSHIVGKWHLGSCSWNYTPTYRGFDSHYGYFQGKGDYWDHTDGSNGRTHWGLDFWDDREVVRTAYGQYSTELFATRAEKIIGEHNTSKPLFLYLPHQAIHSGNPITPLEADWKYLKDFDYITEKHRQKVAGMVSALDDAVGNVTKALATRGMLNNTVIVFSTDNGGPAAGHDMNMACNWPLRGMKRGLWEGGVRGSSFIWSPLLKESGYVSNHMMQIFDWLPTLLKAADYPMHQLSAEIDGIDMWHTLSKNKLQSPRSEMLHNIDPKSQSSLRVGDMKLIYGKSGNSGWYGPGQKLSMADLAELDRHDPDVYWEEVLAMAEEEKDTAPSTYIKLRESESAPDWLYHSDLPDILRSIGREVKSNHVPVVVDCGPKPENASTNCNVSEKPCLYNITADPCEFFNLAPTMPDVVAKLLDRLAAYKATAVPPRNKAADDAALPIYHKGVWAPWLEGSCEETSTGRPFWYDHSK